jgi:hypothetical protein
MHSIVSASRVDARTLWSRVLVIVGLLGMLIGAIDPLEGSLIIAPGTGMVALGTFLSRSRYRVLVCWAFCLVAAGASAMFVLSALGGIGSDSGRSMFWLLVVLPYPVGWIIGLAGGILRLVESFKRPVESRREVAGSAAPVQTCGTPPRSTL